MDTQLEQVRASTTTDWMRGLRPGHAVELSVYGKRMAGRLAQISPDNVTVRIPVADQSADVQRYSVHGTAVISLENGAANVPVAVRALGDLVRLQFIGPPELVQRRQFTRLTIDLPVTVCWLAGQVGVWDRAVSRTKDISTGGLRVACATSAWPSTGTSVLVSFELPAASIQAQAVVIGKTLEYDLRLSFTEIAPESVAQIRAVTG
ncbi:MAG TPA: PilZ domain-containing protein [Kineosporiaceae bacterium]|nr:PilZ domain-containing protein [Kineosporiaceae bacterium]